MTIDSGFETIEFYRSFDTPKQLTFSSREDALTWLNHLCSGNGNSASRLRQLLTQHMDGSAVLPLSNDETARQLADLIYKRRIVVFRKIRFGKDWGSSGGRIIKRASLSVERVRTESPRRFRMRHYGFSRRGIPCDRFRIGICERDRGVVLNPDAVGLDRAERQESNGRGSSKPDLLAK